MYTNQEILTLAQKWSDHYGLTLWTVSRRIFGKHNSMTFMNMAGGAGCHSRNLEKASRWFNENWPEDEPWPLPYRRGI